MGPSEYPHISTKWPVCFPPPVLSGVVQTVTFFFAFFATSYCVTMSGVRMPAGARVVSFLQHIQTGQWPTQPPVHSSDPLSLLFTPIWSTVMFIPTGTLNFRVVAETNSESSNQEYLSCLWSPALIVTKRYATFIAFIVTLYESVWFKEIIWAHTICEAVSVEIHPHSSLTLGPLMEFMAWPLYSWGKRPLTCYTEGWNNFK